ncbi:S-Ena type endospore appendage [Brevibacillus choshinensis]|uniref:S-Ena type endospore appendage n=1 Tax=Brevibacillus choshinensis TaxID=54911 RepID=UPI003D187AD4
MSQRKSKCVRCRRLICICNIHNNIKRPRHRPKKNGRFTQKVVCIRRCVPIKQPCDNTTHRAYFIFLEGPNIFPPSGTITIINNSKNCTMQINLITSDQVPEDVDVGPNSSFTAIVSNLISINVLCKGQSAAEGTGLLELDLHYILMF